MTDEKKTQCYPLEHSWRLWYYKADKSRTWTQNQISLSSFETVEGFWCVYNYIELASRLKTGCDYSLFKSDIQPMWEDERNKRGGRWVFMFPKNVQQRQLDANWLDVMLCLIGEHFGQYSDHICGAVINLRPKFDRISVWTSDCNSRQAVEEIGRILKKTIGFRDTVRYEVHSDSQSRGGSTARAKYTL